MKRSCNGCCALHKRCSENCSIKSSLEGIETPESQANATIFLRNFYSQAGLKNLINSGPNNLRPGLFISLLYEACGRIVNPIFGSMGLICSGNWHLCQAAVEAVLNGGPIIGRENSVASQNLQKVRNHQRFKRPHTSKLKPCKPFISEGVVTDDFWLNLLYLSLVMEKKPVSSFNISFHSSPLPYPPE